MRRLLSVVGALLAGVGLSASAAEAGQPKRPLVYVVVIDGLDGDRVDAGAAPFISSLLEGEGTKATYYPGSRSIMPAVTNSNHAAMMSGAFASDSGVLGNSYAIYAPLANEDSCSPTGPFDFTVPPTVTSGESLTCPRAQFTFEAVKRQTRGAPPTTAGIFGKPKLGRIFAGRNVASNRTDADYLWAPCAGGPEDDDYCDSDAPTNGITGYALDDATVMDEVTRTVQEGVMARGKLRRPRLTFVNLPQVDSAGHAFGTAGPYDTAISQADAEVERLVETLHAEEIWDRSVLVLLSDHSMAAVPGKVNVEGAFDLAGIAEEDYVAVDGDNGQAMHVYLGDRQDPERHELLRDMRAAATATAGVATATYRRPNPSDGGRRFQTSRRKPGWRVGGSRGGDLFLTTAPGNVFIDPDSPINLVPGHHGAPETRDNFLAIVGADSGPVRQGTVTGDGRARRPLNVDVAPTVMRLFGLRPPRDSDGRFLRQAFDRELLPRRR